MVEKNYDSGITHGGGGGLAYMGHIGMCRCEGYGQEGGGVSRVNIGRLITTSVTSRHTSMFFQNGGQFSCSLFLQKMTIFRRSGKLFCRARMTKHLKNRKE